MAVRVVEGKDYRILPDDYRAEFHKHNKPAKVEKKIISGRVITIKYYRCLYCGSLVPHTEMQVDHIIPKTRLMAGILWNPNKAWNLGPSCPDCNRTKSNYVDSRVIKGFQNKLINKYGITRKFADWKGKDLDLAEETTAGDDEKLQKIMPYIMVLVYALAILKPFIILAAWLVQAVLWVGTRAIKIIWKLLGKLTRKCYKKFKKSFKYYATHPHKIYVLAGKVAICAFALYFVASSFGLVSTTLPIIGDIAAAIWALGSGFISNLLH